MSGEQLIRKPGPIVKPGLGQVTRRGVQRAEAPLTRTELADQLRHAQHATCVEHVAVAGLRSPVCIGRGDDREQVLAQARQLAGARP